MQLTPIMFLIVCPLVFLAGLVDAIGGGGGLISLPAYLIAGIPIHMAIATNKLSSACGTTLATLKFIRAKMVSLRLAVPTVIAAMIGSACGARISLTVDEAAMKYILFVVLPVTAFIVLNRKLFPADEESSELALNRRVYVISTHAALVIGFYDGFYGPGTGTFLIIALTVFAKLPMKRANGQSKVINWTTNVTSLAVFLLDGQVIFLLGLAAALSNMAGAWIGASLVMTKGTKIVRPSILLVLVLLFLKILGVY